MPQVLVTARHTAQLVPQSIYSIFIFEAYGDVQQVTGFLNSLDLNQPIAFCRIRASRFNSGRVQAHDEVRFDKEGGEDPAEI